MLLGQLVRLDSRLKMLPLRVLNGLSDNLLRAFPILKSSSECRYPVVLGCSVFAIARGLFTVTLVISPASMLSNESSRSVAFFGGRIGEDFLLKRK